MMKTALTRMIKHFQGKQQSTQGTDRNYRRDKCQREGEQDQSPATPCTGLIEPQFLQPGHCQKCDREPKPQ